MINIFEALLSAVWYTAGAVLFFRMTPERIPGAEKLCRSKLLGIILTLPAALQCVPLAIPVSPGFLLPWLLPAAVILPVLCWFFIDFYAARGFALWMIVSTLLKFQKERRWILVKTQITLKLQKILEKIIVLWKKK